MLQPSIPMQLHHEVHLFFNHFWNSCYSWKMSWSLKKLISMKVILQAIWLILNYSVVDTTWLSGWAKLGEILAIEYLDLNFVTTPKLTPWDSFYAEKVFISCVWWIPILRVHTTSRPFKVFNLVGNRQYFKLIEKKKWFAWEHAKEMVEGLGTGWFVTAINLAALACGCREILPRK